MLLHKYQDGKERSVTQMMELSKASRARSQAVGELLRRRAGQVDWVYLMVGGWGQGDDPGHRAYGAHSLNLPLVVDGLLGFLTSLSRYGARGKGEE